MKRLGSVEGSRHSRERCANGKPEGEPAAFETGVPGEEDSTALPEKACCDGSAGVYQVFHGAFPLDQRSSRCCLSRSVSMACQKP